MFSIPRRETDKGAQKMMQQNRQIPETVYLIWMTSLPDNLGPNEHTSIAMPLIIYHNVDNFVTYLFVVAVVLITNSQG